MILSTSLFICYSTSSTSLPHRAHKQKISKHNLIPVNKRKPRHTIYRILPSTWAASLDRQEIGPSQEVDGHRWPGSRSGLRGAGGGAEWAGRREPRK